MTFVVRTAMMLFVAAATLAGAQTTQTGFVLGRVVDADSGRGIAGVLVAAVPRVNPAGGAGGPGGPGGQGARALTDAQGRFLLRDLPLGSYGLRATVGGNGFSPSGFLVTGSGHQIGAYLNGSYGQSRPDGPDGSVVLAAGAPNLAQVTIRLWKGAAIEGSVVDEAGDPQVGMFVAAVARDGNGRLLTGPSTRTDDRGWFRIGTLRPGEYVVVVPHTQFFVPSSALRELAAAPANAPIRNSLGRSGGSPPSLGGLVIGTSIATGVEGFATTNRVLPSTSTNNRTLVYRTTFYPNAASAGRATPIRLKPGETRGGITIRLEPTTTARLSGMLTDGVGPVANFGVHLMPVDGGDGADTIEVATAITDGRGVFEFPAVPAGDYTLRAEREPAGSAPAGAMVVGATSGGRPAETAGAFAIEHVTVGEGAVTNLRLVLRPGHRLSGRVDFAGKNPRPEPRMLTVILTPTPPVTRSADSRYRSQVDADGNVDLGAVPPGRYVLNIASPAAWPLVSVFADGRDVTDRPFEVTREARDIVITLGDEPASIVGTVRLPSTGNADDVAVFLMPADQERWADGRYSARVFRTVRPDASGRFEIKPVMLGDFLIVAARDAFETEWLDVRLVPKLAAAGTRVTVRAGAASTVSLSITEIR